MPERGMKTEYVVIINHSITDALRSLSFTVSLSLDSTHTLLEKEKQKHHLFSTTSQMPQWS